MPYLPTSQVYLEQSALLLQAYPDTTRITTKYHFPRPQKPASAETNPPPAIASLTLKTFNPTSGICLKYRTNKAAEVGRLITSLGKLAAGADVASLGLSGAAPAGAGPVDVEMVDAVASEETANATTTTITPGAAGKGGKSKKKGGKGKR
ncbi:signal recognition particle 9 kDa protein-domain-containing protein [Aspergillus ambiguus]|uniref:SRP9/SRP21 family protein n=1 Tax=Aspergillus ambiguus TaxID=176160 RepID=UPI003CCDB888